MKTNRRDFLKNAGVVSAGVSLGFPKVDKLGGYFQSKKGPKDFLITVGHYDIWEFNARFSVNRRGAQDSPLKDFILPRLLEGGIDVVIMPATGDSIPERGGSEQVLEGGSRTLNMLLTEIEKTNGKASIILSKEDVPDSPNPDHVKFFLDMEGGETIQVSAEPENHYPGCDLAHLRNFFRLGIRGLQLTHNGRNMLADGVGEGKMAGKLSKFGVDVVEECNRLGILVGCSHLSANGIYHLAEITTKPIVSTHTNPQHFINTPRQHSDQELKVIASTGGVIGVRYIAGQTTYDDCIDIIDYVANLVGIEHIGVGWFGHDVGNPSGNYVPGISTGPFPGGEIEKMTKYEQNSKFIDMLYKRKYSDEHINMVMGKNFLRVMKEVLPESYPPPMV